jgi:hypothetical protein
MITSRKRADRPEPSPPPARLLLKCAARLRRIRARSVFLAVTAALAVSLTPACNGGSAPAPGGSASATSAKPTRMTMSIVLLDDQPDPFETLPAPVPRGVASFQEVVVFGPEAVDYRNFVRLVVQPGETLAQARARAKPWFDARPLPPGDRFVFAEVVEEDEVTKKREAVGVRSFVATPKVVLTQDDVIDASLGAVPDPDNKPQPVALVQLSPDASERFRLFTKENVFHRIAVLVDDNVVMAARIQDEITGGKLSISMDPETPYEAKRAELQRLVDGLHPKPASAPSAH